MRENLIHYITHSDIGTRFAYIRVRPKEFVMPLAAAGLVHAKIQVVASRVLTQFKPSVYKTGLFGICACSDNYSKGCV